MVSTSVDITVDCTYYFNQDNILFLLTPFLLVHYKLRHNQPATSELCLTTRQVKEHIFKLRNGNDKLNELIILLYNKMAGWHNIRTYIKIFSTVLAPPQLPTTSLPAPLICYAIPKNTAVSRFSLTHNYLPFEGSRMLHLP